MPESLQPYVHVALPRPGAGLLTYAAPAGEDGASLVGRRVQVTVGRKPTVGVVVAAAVEAPEGVRIKAVDEVLDRTPSLSGHLLELTRWIANYYLAEWGEVIRAALPAGLMQPPEITARWIGPDMEAQWPGDVLDHEVTLRTARALAGRGATAYRRLAKAVGRAGVLEALDRLNRIGLAEVHDRQTLDREKAHTVERVRLAEGAGPDSVAGNAVAQRRLLASLAAMGEEAPWPGLREHAGVEKTTLTALARAGLVTVDRVPRDTLDPGFDPRAAGAGGGEPPLIPEQTEAVRALTAALDEERFAPFLLTGLPGTGKTRVYIETLRHAVAAGRGALLLVPEIGLTPQVVARIRAALDVRVAVLHSGLTPAQRVAAWREVLEGGAKVVVGPRSAVFAPVRDLGLIVVDEEHEESYKQQDPAPRYHARDVALVRGKREGAVVLAVSATPSLESVRLVDEGRLEPLKLRHRFGSGWPVIHVADRRREAADAPYIGAELAEQVQQRARRGEGVVLLITRRGFAPVLVCRDCGEREECPHCSVPLTYHRGRNPILRCHLCGVARRVPDLCPACQGEHMEPLGAGTQRIEDEVQERFPELAPVRMDADTTRRDGAHADILRAFAEGDAQILLGTQVVAKGHDFAHVSLVGVVNADPSLVQPDFRAAERTFRLLVQAAGRAGRGDAPGVVLVQTLSPDDPVFRALKQPDVEGFLAEQAQMRRALGYPPFTRMAMLTATASEDVHAKTTADELAARLRRIGDPVRVRGPVQAWVPRVKRRWRWRLMVSTPRDVDPDGRALREAIRRAVGDVKPQPGVRSVIDVDPLEVM